MSYGVDIDMVRGLTDIQYAFLPFKKMCSAELAALAIE